MASVSGQSEGLATTPDQIDPRALVQLRSELLYGESVARCWRTAVGFLVMTNLRCIHVWRKPELFVATEWHAGPSFFFYDLAQPRVVAGRFLELLEAHEGSVERSRFLVRDPLNVAREIDSARAAGRAEWATRRATAELQQGRLRSPAPARGATVIVREVVKIRCTFCGNLVDVADANCPFCGAPL